MNAKMYVYVNDWMNETMYVCMFECWAKTIVSGLFYFSPHFLVHRLVKTICLFSPVRQCAHNMHCLLDIKYILYFYYYYVK